MVGKILPPTRLIHVFCVALTSIVIIQDEKLTFIVVCWGFIYSITFFAKAPTKPLMLYVTLFVWCTQILKSHIKTFFHRSHKKPPLDRSKGRHFFASSFECIKCQFPRFEISNLIGQEPLRPGLRGGFLDFISPLGMDEWLGGNVCFGPFAAPFHLKSFESP